MSEVQQGLTALFLFEKRLETFKDWPFTADTGATCTGERLAQTGFYRPNPDHEPDLARCFICHKELEGWEDTDDPEAEHFSHSSSCPFLSLKVKDAAKMKMKDFVKLVLLQNICQTKHDVETFKKDIQKQYEHFEKECELELL